MHKGRRGWWHTCVVTLGWLVLLLPAAGPAQQGTDCDDLRGLPILFGVDWQTEVKPILQARCVGCHGLGQQPDFSDLPDVDAIYKLVGTHVEPGRPLQSRLFDKINCAQPLSGQRMPMSGEPLSINEQALVFDWIAQGALGEPGPPIDRDFLFRDGVESQRSY